MKTNIVFKRDFGDAVTFARLDAEFVDPDLLMAEQKLTDTAGWRLKELVERESNRYFDEPDDPDEPVTYIAIDAVDTDDGLCFPETLLFKDLPSRAKYMVQESDILVSNVRPNRGAITLIGSRSSGALASSGFTLLRLTEDADISAEFLFAFMRTDYARRQLDRRTRSSMYPTVTESDVLDVYVPKPPADLDAQVKEWVENAREQEEEFFRSHTKMQEALDSFLAPYDVPPSPVDGASNGTRWTQVTKRNFFVEAQRIDAEFFRKEYEAADRKFQKVGPSFLLGEHYVLSPGRALGGGEDETPYIKQAVLTNVGINWSAVAYEEGTPGPASARVRAGDILLACTAHEIFYVGKKVDFVRDVPLEIRENNTCVPDLMIIRPREAKPEYLYGSYVAAFLRHDAGKHQVQRCIRGLRGGHVYRDDLARFVRVPLPTRKWLEDFEGMAASMEVARNDAKRTTMQAVSAVEAWVRSLLGSGSF